MHAITQINGRAEMAYVGDKPWHGLGNELTEGATIEEWLAAAGMDWDIKRAFVRYAVGRDSTSDSYRKMDDKVVLFRSDTQTGLGVVSDKFKVVQPRTVMEFFRSLVEAAGFSLNTAGTLFDGRRFWALASVGMEAAIADPRDKVKGYLLLSTACDGSMATEARYTTVRVVCNNTLQAARQDGAKVRVTHKSTFKSDDVKRELGIDQAKLRFAETMDNLRRLADTKLSDTESLIQTAELFNPGARELARKEFVKLLDQKPVQRVAELAIDNHMIGAGMDGMKGTQWGWLNAVTQYVDHESRARSAANRLNSAWFGKGNDVKERAYEMALANVNGATAVAYKGDVADDFQALLNRR